MAEIIEFTPARDESDPAKPSAKTYTLEISTYPDDYLEFTASGIKTDSRSLSRIADELRKIASIINSDVISRDAI